VTPPFSSDETDVAARMVMGWKEELKVLRNLTTEPVL
jgi:hypothetical protein